MLFRKMLRDLKGNLTQFVSIFLMIFMGIFIFTGMNAVGQGMDQSSKKFYKETNIADAYLYGMDFTKEEALQLEQEDKVTKVERRCQVNAMLENDAQKTIQLNIVESNQISANHLVEGEEFNSNISGIWLDSSFARANDKKVGDSFSIVVQGQIITEVVKGLIMNPEYLYALKDENEVIPNHDSYGYAFLSAQGLSQDLEVHFNQLLIETKANKTQLEAITTDLFNTKYAVLVMQADQPSVKMFRNEVNQMKAMQAIFPVVFLMIAILTTLTTMTRITVKQRTQIGSLKALGFSNGKILRHYMSYGVLIGTAGGILGLITGPIMLSSLMFGFQKGFYTMPEWKSKMEPIVFLTVIICIVCCGLSGYMACHKELSGTTAQILRPKAPKISKHTKLEKSRWWNSMRFDFQWNVRDLLRNKLRSTITVLGIIGCMSLIICAFGLRDTIQEITYMSYKKLNTYDTKVNLSESIASDELSELRDHKELQFIQETAVEIEIDGEKQTTLLTVIGDGDYIKQKDMEDNYIDLPKNGVVITNKIAKQKGLMIGDELKWRIYGTTVWITSEIEEVIRSPISQGIFASETAYNKMNQLMKPTAFVMKDSMVTADNNVKNTTDTFAPEQYGSVQSKEDLLETMDTMMETMNVMIIVLIIAAVILGIVVLYNLGVLSFHERVRELTTLKVIGFQYRRLGKLLQMQNIWLTLAGTLLGVPGGYLLLAYMLMYMGDSFDMTAKVSILSYCISVLGTLFLSVLVNWFLSRKLQTIDMVSALKSVE
jgi:putative ABC transport system permease protein